MTSDLFVAALLFATASSIFAFLAATWRLRGERRPQDMDLMKIETKLADMVSELNHVANSHANAVEDRRDELKRVIEMANDRIRRVTSLLSDLEIMETRSRTQGRHEKETVVMDELSRTARTGPVRRSGRRDLHAEIVERAESGETSAAIAERMKVTVNEVEMVLRSKEKRH